MTRSTSPVTSIASSLRPGRPGGLGSAADGSSVSNQRCSRARMAFEHPVRYGLSEGPVAEAPTAHDGGGQAVPFPMLSADQRARPSSLGVSWTTVII